jgi:hypothetical protein
MRRLAVHLLLRLAVNVRLELLQQDLALQPVQSFPANGRSQFKWAPVLLLAELLLSYLFNDLLHPDDKPRKMEGNTEICSEGCNVVNVNVSGGVAGEVGASYLKVYDKVTGLQHELWTGDLSASFGGFTKIPASLVMSVEWGRITSAVSLSDLSGWGLTTSATHVWSGGDSCKRFQWIVGTSGYDNWPGRRVFRWRFRRNDLYQL